MDPVGELAQLVDRDEQVLLGLVEEERAASGRCAALSRAEESWPASIVSVNWAPSWRLCSSLRRSRSAMPTSRALDSSKPFANASRSETTAAKNIVDSAATPT